MKKSNGFFVLFSLKNVKMCYNRLGLRLTWEFYMQENEAEFLRSQRRRRKRIGKMRQAIILIVAGWVILSMILIVLLFVRTAALEEQLKRLLLTDTSAESVSPPADTEKEEEETALPQQTSSAAEDTENLANEGDVHKVYLTFDNSPSRHTEEILDILAAYDVKATFFVIGREDEESQELYRRIVEEGHTLGMRSYSNRYSVIYRSKEAFAEDYRKLKDYLFELTGVECSLYRFPGGSGNQISDVPMEELVQFLNEQGVTYYDWNVSAGDGASAAYTAEEIVENISSDVVKYKTSVVALQDASDDRRTVEVLEPLIESLKAMGAELLPIDENTRVIQSVKADSVDAQ